MKNLRWIFSFCFLFLDTLQAAVALQAAQFGLDALGSILGKMATAKAEVINKTEGYKAEAINAVRQVTNVVNKANVQMQNLVAISRAKGELIRQQGLYQKNIELVVNPLFEVIHGAFKNYLNQIKNFVSKYNKNFKNSKDEKISLFCKLIVMSIQNTLNDYVFLLKKYNYELHNIAIHIQSDGSYKSMYSSVSEVKKQSNKNINLSEVIENIDKLVIEIDTTIDLLMKERSMLQSNNSLVFGKVTAQMLEAFNLMEDRERVKDITDNNQKIDGIFEAIDDFKVKMDLTFDGINDLYTNSLSYLYKIHILLNFNYIKILKMIDLVDKFSFDNKKYTANNIKDDLLKEFEKNRNQLNAEKKKFLALAKDDQKFLLVFKSSEEFLKFLEENNKNLDLEKVSLSLSKSKGLMSNYYSSFSLKNAQFKSTFVQIMYVNESMLEVINKFSKLKDKFNEKKGSDTNMSGVVDEILLQDSVFDVKKDHHFSLSASKKNRTHGNISNHQSGNRDLSKKNNTVKVNSPSSVKPTISHPPVHQALVHHHPVNQIPVHHVQKAETKEISQNNIHEKSLQKNLSNLQKPILKKKKNIPVKVK